MWACPWIVILTLGAEISMPALPNEAIGPNVGAGNGRRKRQVFAPASQVARDGEQRLIVRPRHLFLRHHDRNGDGLLGPEEVSEQQLRSFARTDRNLDGFLDADELLTANTRLGQEARKLEQLRLDRDGQLLERNRLVRSQSRNRPHVPDPTLVSTPPEVANSPASNFSHRELPATTPSAPVEGTPEDLASLGENRGPVEPFLAADPGREFDGDVKGDGLPTAAQILRNLDRDGDGMLDPTEAVDQLSDNFTRLDKDRDGRLSLAEVERGLRLARLFGIKPKQDPRRYQTVPENK